MKTKFKSSRLLAFFKKEDSEGTDCTVRDEEIEEYRTELDERMRESAESILEEMEHSSSLKIPPPVKRMFSLGLLLTSAVLGLFVINQVVTFAGEVESMPSVWRWPTIICIVIFSAIIIYIVVLLLWKFFRLQRNRQINPEALKALSERRHLQQIAEARKREAVAHLANYLKSYPMGERNKRRLIKTGMKETEWRTIADIAADLQRKAPGTEPDPWLKSFKEDFQKTLDSFARRRIRQYALKIGSGTALSPIPIVDQMIVLYGCTGLIKELLLIYNLRPAMGQSWVILSRAVIHTYLSGVIEGAAEEAVDAGADAMSEFMGSSFNFLTGTIGRAVGTKTTEATLNGILIWRLGKSIMRQLQPVR